MATKRWTGQGHDIPQITTITAADTWATGDTATLTINNKDLTLTLGTDVTTTDVTAELAAMVNATNKTDNLVGDTLDETRNFGGQEFGEWREITATSSGAVLTLTGTAGVPFTVTTSENTAGDGTLGSQTDTQTATGKHFFNNAENWEGGVAPTTSDVILFDFGSTDVKYALNNASEGITIRREDTYTGNIGLLPTNSNDSSYPYPEYRQRFLDLPSVATTGTHIHRIGSESSSSTTPTGFTYIDFGTNDPADIYILVYKTHKLHQTHRESVQIIGGNDVHLWIYEGSVSLGAHPTENATEIQEILTSYNAQSSSDAYVRIGTNCTVQDVANTIRHQFGTIDLETSITGTSTEIDIHGGIFRVAGQLNVDAMHIFGGEVIFRGDTINDLHVYSNGTFSCERGTDAIAIAAGIAAWKGATIKDPHGRLLSEAIYTQGCAIEDINLTSKANLTWPMTAPTGVTPA